MNKNVFHDWLRLNLKDGDLIISKDPIYNGVFQVIGPVYKELVPILTSPNGCHIGCPINEFANRKEFNIDYDKYRDKRFIRIPFRYITGIVRKLPKRVLCSI